MAIPGTLISEATSSKTKETGLSVGLAGLRFFIAPMIREKA
jgi:hypothetical protein